MKEIKKLLLLIVLCVMLVGCGSKEKGIVGTWKDNIDGNIYTFNSDGTGQYKSSSIKANFEYEIEGNKIIITYTGNAPYETIYSLNGNKLSMTNSYGVNITYYKK